MNLIFLFMSQKPELNENKIPNILPQCSADTSYLKYNDECYFFMIRELIQADVFSSVKVFFESKNGVGKASFVPGAENYVISNIKQIEEFIDSETVIFVRGGFKHWYDFLIKYKGKNWLICYPANTGRERWLLWDIIFDDLKMSNEIDIHGRYFFPFIKPVNEHIFYPQVKPVKYDLCIGASHIHDKKGQWRTIKLLSVFKQKYGCFLTGIVPGSFRRSEQTLKWFFPENSFNFVRDLKMPGMLSKSELNDVFAESLLFIHLGAGGQNDRSILEAHAAGLPVIFSNTDRFTPLLQADNYSTFIFDKNKNIEEWADQLYKIWNRFNKKNQYNCYNIAEIYQKRMGFYKVILPMLIKLFWAIDETKPNLNTKSLLRDLIQNQFTFQNYIK